MLGWCWSELPVPCCPGVAASLASPGAKSALLLQLCVSCLHYLSAACRYVTCKDTDLNIVYVSRRYLGSLPGGSGASNFTAFCTGPFMWLSPARPVLGDGAPALYCKVCSSVLFCNCVSCPSCAVAIMVDSSHAAAGHCFSLKPAKYLSYLPALLPSGLFPYQELGKGVDAVRLAGSTPPL